MANAPKYTGASAAFGTLPVLKEERELGFWDHTWINVGLAVATWAFLIGGSTALVVGAHDGLYAIIIGNVISISIMAVSVCLAPGKYGIEHYTILRSIFGALGVVLLVACLLVVFGIGWSSVLSIMFGRALSTVVNGMTGAQIGDNDFPVTAFAVLSIFISWLLLWKGPTAVKWLNRIVGPGKIILCVGLIFLIFGTKTWEEINTAPPLAPFADPRVNFMIAVEFNLAAGFGYWPVLGNIARFTRTPRAALWPNMLGVFAAAVIGEVVGLFAALSLGSYDPTAWMIPLGGVIAGTVALLFIGIANITAMVSIFYGICLAMRQAGGKYFESIPWGFLTGALFVPVAVISFFPGQVYDNFFIFVAWTAVAFAPLSGVAFVDYLILRKGRINARSLFCDDKNSEYRFWGGVNPISFLSLIGGALVYWALFNPQTLDAHGPFIWISASIPACIVAGLLHYVLTKAVAIPSGRGGYPPSR